MRTNITVLRVREPPRNVHTTRLGEHTHVASPVYFCYFNYAVAAYRKSEECLSASYTYINLQTRDAQPVVIDINTRPVWRTKKQTISRIRTRHQQASLNAPTPKVLEENPNTHEARTPGDIGVAALIDKPLLRAPR